MYSIVYYDLSGCPQRLPFKNGSKVDVSDLLTATANVYPEIFNKCGLPISPPAFRTFEPTREWQRIIQALSLSVCGRVPSTHDMEIARRLLYSLPNQYKRLHENPWDAVGLLVYLFIGFRFHPHFSHQEDVNRLDSAISFLRHLYSGSDAQLDSILCSHRGRSVPGGSWLAEEIPSEMALKSLGLQLALLMNVKTLTRRSINWMQQGPGVYASTTVFPELFMRYLMNGTVPHMLIVLANQFVQVRKLLAENSSHDVPCALVDLDRHTHETLLFMKEHFGVHWRGVDYRDGCFYGDHLVDIAITLALPEIRRLMPFYSDNFRGVGIAQDQHMRQNIARATQLASEQDALVSNLSSLTRRTIKWFLANRTMHATAKAMYETVFYYLWGKRCGETAGSFAVGLDRDHSEYQVEAWQLGYREASCKDSDGPLLYARRVENPRDDGYLHSVSFRQFWR